MIQHTITVEAGFSSTKIEGLKRCLQALEPFIQTVKKFENNEVDEMQVICNNITNKVQNFKSKVVEAARKKNVQSIADQIKNTCLHRTFLEISDKLSDMLTILKEQSKESYHEAINNLSEGLKA